MWFFFFLPLPFQKNLNNQYTNININIRSIEGNDIIVYYYLLQNKNFFNGL